MRTSSFVVLAVALGAAQASAQTRSAQLLADAPKAALAATPRLLDAALGAADVQEAPVVAGLGFAEHFTKGAVIGMGSTVVGSLIGAGLGLLSNNLIVAALCVALPNLIIPPLLTALLSQLIGNWDQPGRFKLGWPFAGALVVNAALYVVTSFVLAVPWTNVAALLVYSLADGLLMSGASVGLMHLTENKKVAAPTVASFVPGVSETALVPVMKVNL